ncbi:MAG: molybdopterin biosynthesis protein [candidate division NC10 bacterium]
MVHPLKGRKVYLEDIPLDVAVERFVSALDEVGAGARLPGEALPVAECLGRVTARPVWAALSSPHYHAAAMDGVTVRASETRGASEATPIHLKLGEQARWVDTGDPIPEGFNAVIMLEALQPVGDEAVEIVAPVAPWHHVRPMGEDMVATELILPENHRLRPVDLGAAAGCGCPTLLVRRKPRVAIIPTGTELVPPGTAVKPGETIEYNSLMLSAQVEEWGGTATRFPIVPDEYPRVLEAIREGLKEHDVVVVNAGSSAGSEDFTAAAVAELGKLLVHGIAIRPGHPVILGIAEKKPVLGIPGYPVSAAVTFELLGRPLLCRMLGLPLPARPKVRAILTRKVLSPMGEDEFLRVKVGQVEGKIVATPVSRGAGVIMSLVRADGFVKIPRGSEGLHAGAEVTVELFRDPEEIARTIVAIGSHDLTLDLLASWLRQRHPDLTLASANVGSLGGLTALSRGEAHLAGAHLLDEATGEYNLPFVRQTLPGVAAVLVNLTFREQGLIVPKGNPKGIRTLEDLTRPDLQFINRQRGSGTRILLDYQCKQRGIPPAKIPGYAREEYTHLNVAAAVRSGAADCGLGILAAARALDLDFVPLLKERYDLVIPRTHYEAPLLAPLLALIRGPEFKAAVAALGGYDVSRMGAVVGEV